MSSIRKAVIPAAGLGTRFYPLTRAQPKEMLPLVDKPVIHYVVEEAINSGLDEILIIVGAGKDAIINYFDSTPLDSVFNDSRFTDIPDIFFIRQKEQKGLADSLRYSEKFVGDEPFAVLLGDTIYESNNEITVTRQMLDLYDKYKNPIIALERIPPEMSKNYGIVDGPSLSNGLIRIEKLVEKPEPKESPSNLGITGLYALEPEIFDYFREIVPGKNGELQLTDALLLLAKQKDLLGFEILGKRHDIGDMELWLKSFIELLKKNKKYGKLL